MTDSLPSPQELKQCPFCGSPAEWDYCEYDEVNDTGDDGSGYVRCTGCGIEIPYALKDEAIERWNQRTP